MNSTEVLFEDSPGTDTAILSSLLAKAPEGGLVRLPRGIYFLSPEQAQAFSCSLSNSDSFPSLRAGILLLGRKHLILDGQGSTLLCSGQMTAVSLMGCEDITLRNFTIDWDIPLTAEGTIIEAAEDHITLSIDPEKFPFHIENETLYFDGPGWSHKLHLWGHTEFDPRREMAAPDRGDRSPPTRQILLSHGQVQFLGDFRDVTPTPGNILVLRHGDRIHPAILIHDCRNIHLENLQIHASAGLGILAQFSDTLDFSGLQLVPNRAAGRQFAGLHDDGIHLSADSGDISVEKCRFFGLMDDPVNLHGIAVKAERQPKGDIFCGKFMHPQSKGHKLWARPGDRIALVDENTMEVLGTGITRSFHLQDEETFQMDLDLSSESLHLESCSSFSLENISMSPNLICRQNFFGPCRARGLLVTTGGKVTVEENIFRSSGAAIRIAGDVCTWYESGRCRNVTIQNNFFSHTSLTNAYQGGQGIISISPELPRPDPRFPCHRNIRIQKNHFCISDSRILYALCTEGLQFSCNEIRKSPSLLYRDHGGPHISLDCCRDCKVDQNVFLGFEKDSSE